MKKKIIVDLAAVDEEELTVAADEVRVSESGALLFFLVNEANIASLIGGIAHGRWDGFTVEPMS